MTVSAAVELAIMVTAPAREKSPDLPPEKLLSPRERELVTLVAQGHTNAEIAARPGAGTRGGDQQPLKAVLEDQPVFAHACGGAGAKPG